MPGGYPRRRPPRCYALSRTMITIRRLPARSPSEAIGAASDPTVLAACFRRQNPVSAHSPAKTQKSALVDIELVALGIPQRDRVVVKALLEFLAQIAQQRGAEVAQPPGLGVHALLAGLDREVPPAAGVDVEVEAVADGLAVGHDLDPDARSGAIRIDDAVRAPAEPGLGQPDVAPPVVPGDKAGRRRLQHVAQGLGPEAGQLLGVADAVDDELVSDSHGSPLVRPRPRRTTRQVCRGPTTVLGPRRVWKPPELCPTWSANLSPK